MEEAVADLEQADPVEDVLTLTAANRQFHFAILDPCRMPRLMRMIEQLWDLSAAYRSVYFTGARHQEDVNAEHRAILQAVRLRDLDMVTALLAAHRTHALNGLAGLLDGPPA